MLLVTASIASALASSPIQGASATPAMTEARIGQLIARLTLEEKVSLLSGANRFSTVAIERLGIPALRMADGPNGMRTDDTSPASVFPASVALAATWNPALAMQVGEAIGEEAIAKNYQIMLGPAMNIQRVPLGGRDFEYFSEDPHLTGEIAVGWTKGVRATGRLTTPKHYAANNQEYERKQMNANVPERALREIYLPGFHEVVKRADPVMMMTAYNKVNGTFASENAVLLRDILKGEWGFDGAVMSDFGAVHSTAPTINGGLDLEMPGPARQLGAKLVEAVRAGEVTMETLDGAVRRMLRTIFRADIAGVSRKGGIDTPAHRSVSRRAATEAITLLKNDGDILPLSTSSLKSIAVIGPNADARVIQGGGSSEVYPARVVTPLDGLRAALPSSVKIAVAKGADNDRYPPLADPRLFSTTPAREDRGLRTGYWIDGAVSGAPAKSFTDEVFMKFRFGDEVVDHPASKLAVRSEGYFWPPHDGVYQFQLVDLGTSTLEIDGKPVITPATPAGKAPLYDMLDWDARLVEMEMKAGRPYPFRFTMLPAKGEAAAYRIGVRLPAGSIEEAVAAARQADVALVFVGSSTTSESETSDRDSLALFGQQDALVEAVAAANPRTVVILGNGGPLVMPWADRVPAIVESWFLGGETGHAIADILLGNVNPSGKLPLTFPKRLEDNPTYAYYPGGLEAHYGEGIFVGYRWYDEKGIEPLFPFGHGLSYTRFAFGKPVVRRAGKGWTVSVDIHNTGQRAGAEVAQLYVGLPAAAKAPPHQLRRFEKVMLKPGERRSLNFTLNEEDLSYWDAVRHGWTMPSGTFSVSVGGSSRDLSATAEFRVGDGR